MVWFWGADWGKTKPPVSGADTFGRRHQLQGGAGKMRFPHLLPRSGCPGCSGCREYVCTATLVTFCPLARRAIVCQKYAMGTIVRLLGCIEWGFSKGRYRGIQHFWRGPRYWKPI